MRIARVLLAACLSFVAVTSLGCDRAGSRSRVPSGLRGTSLTFGEAKIAPAVVHIDQSFEVDGRARIRGYGRSFKFIVYNEKSTKIGVPNDDVLLLVVENDQTVSSVPKAGIYDVEQGPKWGAQVRRVNGKLEVNGTSVSDDDDLSLRLRALEFLKVWNDTGASSRSLAGRTIDFGDTIRLADGSALVEMQLVDVTDYEGKRHAVFHTEGTATAVSADKLGFGKLDAEFRGETLVDIASGRVVRVRSSGPLNMSVLTDGEVGKLKGTIEIDYRVRYEAS